MSDAIPTPSAEDVREAYAMVGRGIDFRSVAVAQGEAFDRWLAARDAQVLREAAQWLLDGSEPGEVRLISTMLKARADRIEQEAQ